MAIFMWIQTKFWIDPLEACSEWSLGPIQGASPIFVFLKADWWWILGALLLGKSHVCAIILGLSQKESLWHFTSDMSLEDTLFQSRSLQRRHCWARATGNDEPTETFFKSARQLGSLLGPWLMKLSWGPHWNCMLTLHLFFFSAKVPKVQNLQFNSKCSGCLPRVWTWFSRKKMGGFPPGQLPGSPPTRRWRPTIWSALPTGHLHRMPMDLILAWRILQEFTF